MVVDIRMHPGLTRRPPARVTSTGNQHGLPVVAAGARRTPEPAGQLPGGRTGLTADVIALEMVRYLGMPGQAICHEPGERARVIGREATRARRCTTAGRTT